MRKLLTALSWVIALTCPLDIALAAHDHRAILTASDDHGGATLPLDHVDIVDRRDDQVGIAERDPQVRGVVCADHATHLDGMTMPTAGYVKEAATPQRKQHPLDPAGTATKVHDGEPASSIVLPRPEDEVCTLDAGRIIDCFSSELGGAPRDDETNRAKQAYEERYSQVDLVQDKPRTADRVAMGNLFDRSPLGAQITIVLVLGLCTYGLIPIGLIFLGSRHLSRQVAAVTTIGAGVLGALASLRFLYG